MKKRLTLTKYYKSKYIIARYVEHLNCLDLNNGEQ